MNELITIIVPIYKVEDYLQRCVDSILKQSYINLEIILVDDGSPDNCAKICDEYAKNDNRIKVIHKKNGGLSDARNAGIEISQGEFITFVDSDDWIHKDYVKKLYKILKGSDSDISVGNFLTTSTENIGTNIETNISNEQIYEYSSVEALEQMCGINEGQMVVAWGKLYKKYLFDEIRFPVGRIHEDEFTTYKLFYKAKKIAMTTMQLLYYFQRGDSIIGAGFNIKHKMDALDALEERAEFFRAAGLEELSGKTYKLVFFIYLSIVRRIYELEIFDNIINKKKFNSDFKELRNNLRKSRQKIKFRLFYEMYFIAPKAIDLVYKFRK